MLSGLDRDVTPSAWLHGMLLVIAARLGEAGAADSDLGFGQRASLRRALRRALRTFALDDPNTRSTGRGSKVLGSGARSRPQHSQADGLVLGQVHRPPRWWTNGGSSIEQNTDAQNGGVANEHVMIADMSIDAPKNGISIDAMPSLGNLHTLCSEKALHLFQRARTSWHNQTSWHEQQAYLEGLTKQFDEACKQEDQIKICKVLRRAAAALSAPRRLQADLGGSEPLDEVARNRLQRAFQTKLRAMILQCLNVLGHNLSISSPALLHIRALILQFEESFMTHVSAARGGKQWQLLKSVVDSELTPTGSGFTSLVIGGCLQKASDEDEHSANGKVALKSSSACAPARGAQAEVLPSTRPPASSKSKRGADIGDKVPRSHQLCPHGRRRDNCKECRGDEAPRSRRKCEHGRRTDNCKECHACPHGKLKWMCRWCQACPHGKFRQGCETCNGCPHGRLKRSCRVCDACPHGKLKRGCKACTGCPHGRVRTNCVVCIGACEHGKIKRECGKCTGCPHGVLKRHCSKCSACSHGRLKRECRQCSSCQHGKLARKCTVCKSAKIQLVPLHQLH